MSELGRNVLGQVFNGVTDAIEYPLAHPIKSVKAVGWAILAANAFNMAKHAAEVGAEYLENRKGTTSYDS
jgi:hypothetical protein